MHELLKIWGKNTLDNCFTLWADWKDLSQNWKEVFPKYSLESGILYSMVVADCKFYHALL